MIFLAHMKRMFKWAFLTTCFPSVCLSFQLSTFHKFFSNLLHQKWPNLHQRLYILYMWPRTNNWVPTGVQSYHWNIWRKSFEIFFQELHCCNLSVCYASILKWYIINLSNRDLEPILLSRDWGLKFNIQTLREMFKKSSKVLKCYDLWYYYERSLRWSWF